MYAYSQLDFSQKSSEWQQKHCTQKLVDQRKANYESALCNSLQQGSANKEDIANIQSVLSEPSSGSSFYRIIDQDFITPQLGIGSGGPYVARAIVPRGGIINTLTVTKQIPLAEPSGSAIFTLYINDVEQELETIVDAENPESLTVIEGIEVQSGDTVAVKQVGNLGSFSSPIKYHVALYVESE